MPLTFVPVFSAIQIQCGLPHGAGGHLASLASVGYPRQAGRVPTTVFANKTMVFPAETICVMPPVLITKAANQTVSCDFVRILFLKSADLFRF